MTGGRLSVSTELHRTVTELGPEAERWLESLPVLVSGIATEWELDVGPAFHHAGCASIILPAVTRQADAAVLKLSVPHKEAQHESVALRHWDGDGAVSILRASADGFTLLLERCEPGSDLWAVGIDDQIEVMADLLPRLWTAAPPDALFADLGQTATRWARQMHQKAAVIGIPAEVADRAQRWARELATDQPRRMLHGDFHPGNILAARRHAWLAIDPKPWIGDPAFDLAQVLGNWVFVDPASHLSAADAIRTRAAVLAERLSLDLDPVMRWALAKAIGWGFGRDKTLVIHDAATVT